MRALLAVLFSFLITAPAHATEIKEVVSDKGLKAWLVEEHSQPLVAIKIAFKNSGSAYDADGKEGRANMAAALLLEGAGELDARAFGEAVDSHAIRLNAGVDEDLFKLSLESLSEHKEKAFSYLGLALTKPRFDDSAIARVRGQTISLITEQEGRPAYQLERTMAKLAFGSHPYAKPMLGTKESVASLDRGDFRKFMKRYITKENMVIAAVGDITADELKRLLDDNFATLADKYDADSKVEEISLSREGKIKIVDFDIPQTMVAFATQAVKRDDPDYFDAYVMNQILGGGGLNSKLSQEIRDKRGLAYSVFSGLNPMAHAASWQGRFATRNEKAGEAVETLRAALKEFAENGPSDAELRDAKQYIKDSFVLNLDSNSEIASFLINMQVNSLGIDYLKRRNELVDAVKKEGVADMAKRLADPQNLLLVMVGKPKEAQ